MATLLPAILTKYDALSAANFAGGTRPPAFHDRAPQVTSGQLRPPYAVFGLRAEPTQLTFEDDGVEVTRVTLRVYATSEADLDSDIAAIARNGGSVGAAGGFDSGTLPALTDGTLLSMVTQKVPSKHFDGVEGNGTNVYRAEFEWLVEVQRS